ncbi:MAG: hypothetical protein ACREV9_07295 [Burkholderiales bacterium]
MSQRLHEVVARVMLFVILATFLSPTLGWEMIASHDDLAHSDRSMNASVTDHDYDGSPKDHEHENPHGFIGHLLTHMPLSFSSAPQIAALPPNRADLPDPLYSVGHNFPEPPFRPPYLLLA